MAPHLTHWGAFDADSDGHALTSVRPWSGDPDPSALLDNVASAQHHRTRVDRPHIRRGWLDGSGNRDARGRDEFVPVSWDTAVDALAAELGRVYRTHGAESVFGGSYGWGSAGRFHHAQSQVHRFLNCLGGYVRSVNSYSYGASSVLLPHVIGDADELMASATPWPVLAEHTELMVGFGGISGKNSAVAPGGIARHGLRASLSRARERGCRFVSVSPLRDDTPAEAQAEHIAPVPGSDAAMMLALAHVLDAEGLADTGFLDRCTVGYPRFADYLRGGADGIAKTPEWAAERTGVAPARIRSLARDMAAHRTLVTVSWSLQRTQYGEQPLWLGVVLAAMLGQIGLPGGGFGHGYGSSSDVGQARRAASAPALPQGHNPVAPFIPVARVADMLLHPGEPFDYDGHRLRYPGIRLVYWCGGNPFHHHQNLARLREAFTRPETVVVHDPFWTSTARHADIVLPSTMSVERADFGAGKNDPALFPMHQLTAPHEQARDDYDTFTALSERLGTAEAFTEGRTSGQWLRHLYDRWQERLAADGHPMPGFDEFWDSDHVRIPVPNPEQVLLERFRADPGSAPLSTPSGRIEIFSATIDGFGHADCPGHPAWLEPAEWLGSASESELHLIANQPRARLHSQLDVGAHSLSTKIHDREPARMHPDDAAARGLADGDLALLHNARGRCLVGIVLSTDVRAGVVQLSTGAWYDPDPDDPGFCRHGNPNVLTADRPTSALSQGCTGQHALVEVCRYDGPVPELAATEPPVSTTVDDRRRRSS